MTIENNTVSIGTNGFDQPKYEFRPENKGEPVSVMFKLMDGLDHATIHYAEHVDRAGTEANLLIATVTGTETTTVPLKAGSRYIIHLPHDKNPAISSSGTNSGTIDVPGSPVPRR